MVCCCSHLKAPFPGIPSHVPPLDTAVRPCCVEPTHYSRWINPHEAAGEIGEIEHPQVLLFFCWLDHVRSHCFGRLHMLRPVFFFLKSTV